MGERFLGAMTVGCLLVLAACSDGREAAAPTSTVAPAATKPAPSPPTTEEPSTTTERSTTTTSTTTTSTTVAPTTTTTTALPTTTTAAATTTTTTVAVEPVGCTRQVQAGDSLSVIVAAVADEAVNVASVSKENGITDPNTINAGDTLDICVGNGIDDVTGKPRVTAPPPPPAPDPAVAAASGTGVAAQQQKLNALFAAYGMPALDVDGVSGRQTEQLLCAARVALGLPISRADMEPGSPEEQALMGATSLVIPSTAPVGSSRWVLIDQTCQVMFAGEGANRVVFVFKTSTGEAGFETRDQNGARAFRYDPATDNAGWHNSYDYPVTVDNPLNGNMYKPLYFDRGQAIHGANNVPTSPQSKGCARLRVENQQSLVDWLGLGAVTRPIWDSGPIDLTVNVQGRY